MPGSDSIEFLANYKGWIENRCVEIYESTSPAQVAHVLASIRNIVDRRAFEVLGVDTKALEVYSEKLAKAFPKNDYKSLALAYKSLGSSDSDSEIAKASADREEIRPFAKVFLLRSTALKLGLMWYVSADNKALATGAAAGKAGATPPGIAFMAKYKEWISIKKLSVTDDTKPEEVSAHLSSIRMTTDRKLPQILGINTEDLDAYASASVNKMRKSAANIEKIVDILCSEETKSQIDSSIPSENVRGVAVTYLFGRMLQNIKLDLEVSPDTLMSMLPGLKIPKPRGRMPGKKKKQKQ